MKIQIVCAGIGGRGVLLASTILIETAVKAGLKYPGKSRISDFIREISVSICGQQYLSFKDVLP